jgi:hypothetical protein
MILLEDVVKYCTGPEEDGRSENPLGRHRPVVGITCLRYAYQTSPALVQVFGRASRVKRDTTRQTGRHLGGRRHGGPGLQIAQPRRSIDSPVLLPVED